MELLGFALWMVALFVAFGLVVGVLFGFFGMGGSFLVTPALLVLGFEPTVAVGSGMAFVFGTAVIATLKHRDLGQVDYELGVLMIVGTVAGIEVGRELVVWTQAVGVADSVISVVYVLLLGAIGLLVTYEALSDGSEGGIDRHATDGGVDDGTDVATGHEEADVAAAGSGEVGDASATAGDADADVPDVARRIQSYRIPPMVPCAAARRSRCG